MKKGQKIDESKKLWNKIYRQTKSSLGKLNKSVGYNMWDDSYIRMKTDILFVKEVKLEERLIKLEKTQRAKGNK